MTDTREPRAPLTVETDLELTIDGDRAALRSTGERLFLEVPSLPAALRTVRSPFAERVEEIAALLAETGLTVEVRSRGRTVVAVGADARPGPLSRLLGAAPAQVRVGGVLGAVGQEVAARIRFLRSVVD